MSCCMCDTAPKYRCPGCLRRSCSLPCVTGHKTRFSCTGKADRTSYVSISSFTTENLISDYKFLEEVKEEVDGARREGRRQHHSGGRRNVRGLVQRCRQRDIPFARLPSSFSRSLRDETCLKGSLISWSLEWVFPDRNVKIIRHFNSEEETLAGCMDCYRNDQTCFSEYKFLSVFLNRNPEITYLMKAEMKPTECYYKLDPDSSIRENLKYKLVIGFPVILVTGRVGDYQVIECKEVDVGEFMTEHGLTKEQRNPGAGGQKRGRGRRKFNRKRKRNGDGEDSKEAGGKSSERNNPFRNQVMELFGGDDGSEDNTQMGDSDDGDHGTGNGDGGDHGAANGEDNTQTSDADEAHDGPGNIGDTQIPGDGGCSD